MLTKELAALAEAYGLEVSYVDDSLQNRHSPPEGILAVLRVLGASLERADQAADALRQRRQAHWQKILEPVTLAWDGHGGAIVLRLPARQTTQSVRCTLDLEFAETRTWTCALPERVPNRAANIDGVRYYEYWLPLPSPVPLGYHRLRLEVGQEYESLVVAAPTTSYRPADGNAREWGVFLPLYALRTARDAGIGDFTDLENLLAWTQAKGGSLVSTLPLTAAFVYPQEKIFEPSPYAPASRLFWNEIFLNLERIPELTCCSAAVGRLASTEFRREAAELRQLPLVDYRRVMGLKREVLTELAAAFFARPSSREVAFRRFLDTHPRGEDYACFRAACERHGTSWWCWPERQRQGTLLQGDFDERLRQYHLYVQWQAHEQLAALAGRGGPRGGLYLDLPLGSSSDSYDVWRERAIFALGASAGAPPDSFAIRGQDWGFPPVNPERQREQGYHYFREVLGHLMQFAYMLRIDHLLGLHRLFFIPVGAEPSAGVYVRSPYEELYAVFCLQSYRHQVMLVGEDLGIVPATVHPAMARHKVDRLFVAQFQYRPQPDGSEPQVPDNAVASMSTHDLPPFAAFWRGLDLKDRLDLGLIDAVHFRRHARERADVRNSLAPFFFPEPATRDRLKKASKLLKRLLHSLWPLLFEQWSARQEFAILQKWLTALGSSPARVVLVNLEDLWLSSDPQNVPGTWRQRPNWRRRSAHPLEKFARMPGINETLRELDRVRRQSTQHYCVGVLANVRKAG